MAESYWANTHLSIARYCGGVRYNDHEYVIVNKEGKDIFECSRIAEKEGREKAIEPGEPADLCRVDFVPIYRKLGREKFLAFCKAFPDMQTPEAARQNLKQWASTN